jgi:hypothetical protein
MLDYKIIDLSFQEFDDYILKNNNGFNFILMNELTFKDLVKEKGYIFKSIYGTYIYYNKPILIYNDLELGEVKFI